MKQNKKKQTKYKKKNDFCKTGLKKRITNFWKFNKFKNEKKMKKNKKTLNTNISTRTFIWEWEEGIPACNHKDNSK